MSNYKCSVTHVGIKKIKNKNSNSNDELLKMYMYTNDIMITNSSENVSAVHYRHLYKKAKKKYAN